MTELEKQVGRLRTLARLNQLVSSSLDLARILNEIAAAAAELTEAEVVSLWVADEATRTLHLRASSNEAMRADHPSRTLRFGEGGVGWVAEHRRPLAVPDFLDDARLAARDWFPDHGLRSGFAVPIIHQDSILGVLAMLGREPFAFERDDQDLLDSFVAQAAIAIRHAQVFADSETRRRAAEALVEVGRLVSATLDPDIVSARIAESICRLLDARSSAIYRLEAGSRTLVLQAVSSNVGRTFHWTRVLAPGTGLASRALRERQPVASPDVLHDPDIVYTSETRAALADATHRAVLAVPLFVQDWEFGAISVGDRTGRPFTSEERQVAWAFANQAALALENARLYEETERRRRAAESLAELSRLITQSLDPREVGQRVVESLCRLVDGSAAAFYRAVPESGDLELLVGTGALAGWNIAIPKGTAAIGLAVSKGRPVVTTNVLDDPRITLTPETRALIERADFRSILALPLSVGSRVIGGLTVCADSGRVFGPEDVALAQSFADQAALAVENARLYAEAIRRRWEAEVLGDVGRFFSESLDADEVAQRIADGLRALLGAEASLVCRLEPESGDLVGYSQSGDEIDTNVVFPSGTGVMGVAVRERRPITTPNLLTDPRITLTPALLGRIEAAGYRSVLALPLVVKGVTIGAIAICDREGRQFGTEDLHLAQTFADQAAMALESARLFEETRRRRREAEVVAALAQQINAALDLDTVLERLSEAAKELCGADLAWVALSDRDSGAMTMRYAPGARTAKHLNLVIEPGKGIGGQVLLTGRPCRTDDYTGDPRLTHDYVGAALDEGVVTALVVPIQTEGRIEGLLYVENRSARPFTAQDEAILTRLGDHAAIAIRNAQLLDHSRTRQARLEALLDVSNQLAQIQPVESLLDAITRACGQVLDTDSVGFRVVEGDALVIAGTWGDAKEIMATLRLKIGESLSGLVAATGTPLFVEDATKDPRLLPAHRETMARLGYRAWLGVPVKIGERVVGVLSIRTRREGGFSKEEQAIAGAFASQAATALENSRLFQEVQRAYTEVSRAQEELMHAQKMDAIGRLAGGMAHDFNNLLTIVHGRSEILLRRLGADPKSRHDVEVIQQTALRAAALTRQLLAFSRKQVLQPKVLSLHSAVADAVAMFRRLIGEDIDLVVIPGAGLDRVKADPTQLEQILINLAVNARDAMPRGGRLAIETANVELDEPFVHQHPGSRSGPHVRLSVSDSGVGMSAEIQARAFEPFFTTKEQGKGTGLGLATVYGIVKQHDGCIELKSAPGEGTTVSIYLPRIEAAQDAPTEKAMAGTPGGSETILLVEDEDEVRELAREILEMHGYTVIDAASGAEALRVCRQHETPIHLLLTDVVMPKMSGRELGRQVETLRPTTKVVYMSGYTDDALGHHGVLEPGIILLEKPFTPESLLSAVRSGLD